jgi:hypothetical protein
VVGREAGEHERVESGLTTFLTDMVLKSDTGFDIVESGFLSEVKDICTRRFVSSCWKFDSGLVDRVENMDNVQGT